jgi:chemotaxis protein MotB
MKTLVNLGIITTFLVGCGVPEEIYQRDVNALKKSLQESKTAYADLDKKCTELSVAKKALMSRAQSEATKLSERFKQCMRELGILQSKGGKLDSKLGKALGRINRLEALATKQRAVFQKLREAVSSLVKAGKLQVAMVRGQFTLQLRDKILFDTGQSYLKKVGKETLVEVAQALSALPGRRYQVAGHTDSVGGASGNWKLSSERAWSVTKTLIKAGVASNAISYAGYGQFQPTASNEDDESRALNRRIEIVLIPDMEEIMAPLLDKPTG